MGEVYLAEDPQIDRQLAIKTVRLAGRPQEVEDRKKRLLREARAAGRMLHPNIVTLFDAGEAEGLLFLAFEYVEGTDLAGRLDSGDRPSLGEVLRIGRQTAQALDYAHGQGIVHRDVKPSNILLDRAGRVKVADFGIAKMAGQNTELTVSGSVMGSPQYLSPEQIRGEDLDGRSDIFSLGVLLYEILSGKRPFAGDTITTLVYQILHVEPPPISELRSVPPRLEALLRRMLAKDPADRPAAAGEVARELAVLEAELPDETLSARAAPLEATYALPKKSSGAVVPPPPPFAGPPALGTVPASPPTTPSIPPPPAAVPRPAPHPIAPLPVRPGVGQGAAAVAPVRSRSTATWGIIAFGLLLVAALAGAGYMIFQRLRPQEPVQTVAQTPGQEATPGPPATTGAETPSQSFPEERQSPPRTAEPRVEDRRITAETPAVMPTPSRPENQRLPPAPSETTAPVPAPRNEPVPAEPVPEPSPEPEPDAPSPSAVAADRTVKTGLTVVFRVVPPDAFVLVEGRVLGMARNYSGQKGTQTYTFPGPGTYLVKIKKDGMNDVKIAVEASNRGGTTPIVANLLAREAEELDATELDTVRVQKAVAFRVRPPVAAVLVDGQPVGPARQYSGGVLRGGGWLELAPGHHRISIVAPGHRRKDIRVEVTPTADKERERIEVVLAMGGNQ